MQKKIFILFLVITFILNTAVLYSQGALSLEGLLKEARENNPEILAAKKRYEASLARIPQAKSLDNPSVGISFWRTPGSPFRLKATPVDERMLSVNQMLPFFGKLSLKAKIALVESQMLAGEYKNKELEIINEVKNAYYDLFMHHKAVELNRESLVFLEAIVKIAEARYITREVSQEELFKINSEIARLSNEIKNHEAEKNAHETHLNTLLNRESESPLGYPGIEEEISFDKDINYLNRLTLENQPELLIFSYAIEKNKYAKALAKKSYFPDLMAGIVLRGITSGSLGPWDLMLAFSVPLWFWTKQRYEVKEAIANLEEAEAAYTAMKNKTLFRTKDLFSKIEIARNKVNLYKTNLIPILESSIEVSLTALRSGRGDFMMLLDNERMLIETKMNYYKALVEYNMNLADLERATGGSLIKNPEVKNAQ